MATANKEKFRLISEIFFNDLTSGVLAPLTKKLKEEELVLCFRNGYVNIYYKCGSLYKIEEQKDYYNIQFDFNYAKKTDNKKIQELKGIGFELKESGDKNTLYTKKSRSENLEDFFEISIPILKKFIDDHKGEKITEKKRQQEIFIANNDPNSDFFIYDMEYMPPDRKAKGRIDFLAIKKVEKGYSLVICELKTKEAACTGNSGVSKHYKDFHEACNNKGYIKDRQTEAKLIYENYCKLNGIQIKKLDFKDEPEILFIYTDEAREYMKKTVIELESPFKINFSKS